MINKKIYQEKKNKREIDDDFQKKSTITNL